MGSQQRIDKNHAYLAASLVGYALELKAENILVPDRGSREMVQARQVAMYLSHVGLEMSLSRVAPSNVTARRSRTLATRLKKCATKRSSMPGSRLWKQA